VNAELRSLLANLGIEASTAVLMQNAGPIPAPRGTNRFRGFKLILLNARGTATHFCRCAPAEFNGLADEAEIMLALRKDPAIATILPEVALGVGERIRLLITPFALRGDYTDPMERLPTRAWETLAREVINGALDITIATPALVPRFALDPAPLQPLLEATNHLDALTLVLDAKVVATLRAFLRDSPAIPRAIQHGDLWAGNLLDLETGWRLVDFEIFGQIQMPMYDVFHFLRTCLDMRPQTRAMPTWLDMMRQDHDDVVVARKLLRAAAERASLDARQRLGACVYYVTDFAGRLAMRGTREVHRRFYREAEAFAAALDSREDLDTILFGAR
jgi:hypothetical protein